MDKIFILTGINEIEDTTEIIGGFFSEKAARAFIAIWPDGETPVEHENRIDEKRRELRRAYGENFTLLECIEEDDKEYRDEVQAELDGISAELRELTTYRGGTFDDFAVQEIPLLDYFQNK